jgi:hypothetical protein
MKKINLIALLAIVSSLLLVIQDTLAVLKLIFTEGGR